MSVSEILPNLWIGNKDIIKESEFKKRNNICCVINCTTNLPFYGNQYKYRIPVNDDLTKTMNKLMFSYFNEATILIHKFLKQRKGVLVHCHAGIQRSASVVAAYIMKYGNLNLNMTIDLIQSKRNICFKPCTNFKLALKVFENSISK